MNRKEEILAECIDEIMSGRATIEDCLSRYPDLSNSLRPLLEVALSIEPPKVTPSPEFRTRLRSHLLEEMEPVRATKTQKASFRQWFLLALPTRVTATIVLVLAVILGGGTSVYASQSSLPGDILYPVKIGVEKLQVAVMTNPEQKAYLHLKLAQRRIDEVAEQVSLDRNVNVSALASLSLQTDAALREISKIADGNTADFFSQLAESTINQQVTLGEIIAVSPEEKREPLHQVMEVVQRTNLVAQAAYGNSGFLDAKPSVSDSSLEQGKFTVDGILLKVDEQTWNIGGLILSNVNYQGEIPTIGSQISVEGLSTDKKVFITSLEGEGAIAAMQRSLAAAAPAQEQPAFQTESTQATVMLEQKAATADTMSGPEVRIEGRFEGTSESGTTWYVGGASISASQDRALPIKGDKVRVQGVTQDSSLSITGVKKQENEDEEKREAKVEGKLSAVDAINKVITVRVAGASISVNVSSAKIRNKDDEDIKLSTLSSLIGKEIKAFGLVRKQGVLYSEKVRVNVERGSTRDKEESSD